MCRELELLISQLSEKGIVLETDYNKARLVLQDGTEIEFVAGTELSIRSKLVVNIDVFCK